MNDLRARDTKHTAYIYAACEAFCFATAESVRGSVVHPCETDLKLVGRMPSPMCRWTALSMRLPADGAQRASG